MQSEQLQAGKATNRNRSVYTSTSIDATPPSATRAGAITTGVALVLQLAPLGEGLPIARAKWVLHASVEGLS